jgi:integrase
VLLGCGLRRAELLRIQVEDLQQREGRWVLPDLTGKGNRIRTVTVPAGVKARIDAWLGAAGITTGRLFRPVNKGDVIVGTEIRDEKGSLAPGDGLRRSNLEEVKEPCMTDAMEQHANDPIPVIVQFSINHDGTFQYETNNMGWSTDDLFEKIYK